MCKRVLVISSFFETQYRYQEVQLADTLHRFGYCVYVITSNRSQFDKSKRVGECDRPYSIIRLKYLLRIENTLYPFGNIRRWIKKVDPETVVLVHPNHGLPYFALRHIPKHSKVVSVFGDLARWRHAQSKLLFGEAIVRRSFASELKGNMVQLLIKDRWYRRVFSRSRLIVANSRETMSILKARARHTDPIETRLALLGLGYDSHVFYYNKALRNKVRKQYGFEENNIVLVTVTRVSEHKPVLEWISPVLKAMESNTGWGAANKQQFPGNRETVAE